MGLNHWLSLLSCAGHLALAMLAILHGAQSTITLPLALAYVCSFAWNFASIAFDLSAEPGWFFLERASSPFSAPLAFHLIAGFVGGLRRTRPVIVLGYLAAASISLPAVLAFVVPGARAFTESRTWAALHLGLAVPLLVVSALLLVAQLRGSFDPGERRSTQLVLASLVTGAVLVPTELLADLGLAVPRLGHIGTLAASMIMALAALRLKAFETVLSWRTSAQAFAVGVLAICAYMAVFSLLAGNLAMVVWGTATVTLVLIITLRTSAATSAARRQRLEYLATLGRFSAQMAHDLKNPLAAMKGAVQFLLAEPQQRSGRDIEFLRLMEEQVARMQAIIDQYQRLGRVRPVAKPTALNDLIRRVLAMQTFPKLRNITLRTELSAALPACAVDSDLLAGAFENVIYNAVDAMPSGGTLTVRTAIIGGKSSSDAVLIAIEDSGVGMDARVRERAFDDFYTTKAHGTGLGLAFVKRVVEAHGGDVDLSSALGRGTSVRVRLPLNQDRQT